MSQPLNELFMAGCGVFCPWTLRILHPTRKVALHTFTVPYAFVGSQADNCLCLDDSDVSRRHAYLQALPGGVFCVDLGSRLGTRWHDKEQDHGWLRPDRPVQVGPFTLELISTNRSGWLAGPSWAPNDPLSDHMLEANPLTPVVGDISLGSKVLAEWRMNRMLALVGRSPKCQVYVRHKSLSRLHCSLVRTPLGLWVVDLLSRKGTLVNSTRVRSALVKEGDVLKAGRYSLRFWYQWPQPKAVAQLANRQGEGSPDELEPAPETSLEPVQNRATTLSVVLPNGRQTQLAGQAGPDNALVLALVNQFNELQQQMSDQFQKSLLMATQVFASLHQEQMDLVRHELESLRSLTAELRSLKDEMSQKPANVAAAPAETVNEPPVEKDTAAQLPIETKTEDAASKHQGIPAPAERGPTITPVPLPARAAGVHDWLNERISSLQEERQTRLSRLLGKILGH